MLITSLIIKKCSEKVVDTFNEFFVNIGNTLKIDKDKRFLVETNHVFDLVIKAIKKYNVRPSIFSIKEKMNINVSSFRNVTYEEILNKINNLHTSTSARSESIPFKINKDRDDIFAKFILKNFNQCIIDRKFPNQLKKAIVSPAFKKGKHNCNTNYQPMSILPWIPKIYECLNCSQINQMRENASSIYYTQHVLIAVISKAKKSSIKVGHSALF